MDPKGGLSGQLARGGGARGARRRHPGCLRHSVDPLCKPCEWRCLACACFSALTRQWPRWPSRCRRFHQQQAPPPAAARQLARQPLRHLGSPLRPLGQRGGHQQAPGWSSAPIETGRQRVRQSRAHSLQHTAAALLLMLPAAADTAAAAGAETGVVSVQPKRRRHGVCAAASCSCCCCCCWTSC